MHIYEDSSWHAVPLQMEELSISKSIAARGQFGASFMLGRIRTNVDRFLPTEIEGKTMVKSCTESEKCFNGLRSEMNILHDLCHSNVLQLIGYCVEDTNDVPKLILVYEYCANGNLLKVLQKGRPYFDVGRYSPTKAINNEILSPEIYLNICGWHLLRWVTEIARGMEYLAFKGIVHGDLAARNVLLTCDWTAKICNFGVAQRRNIQDSYAKQLSKQVLPLAWMAPETIQNFTYSEKSDVWMFSITLWEIYTLGDIPYKDENFRIDEKFWALLLQDVRPSRPPHMNENIFGLLKSCWSFNAQQRPTFSKIKSFLERTVKINKSKWEEGTLSSQKCSGTTNETLPKKKKANKTVTFVTPNNSGVLRKFFHAADDFLSQKMV
ncbi:Fibroblast growth factor receptor 1 [Orchesella cincta]|uniref:Fibroblast growth factor receptor 1 n=1 Tax=Orchesella cincta TaxID=48709 RepID=A0A1D2NLX6_ORCCI|nr:Fibroblast growth factor receptor 1 [Orchesella cincta]